MGGPEPEGAVVGAGIEPCVCLSEWSSSSKDESSKGINWFLHCVSNHSEVLERCLELIFDLVPQNLF